VLKISVACSGEGEEREVWNVLIEESERGKEL
jgi:hypothetical protein